MSPGRLGAGVLLAVGTLTVLRVPAPRVVDRGVAAVAMALAPLAVLPLAAAAGALVLLGEEAGLSPLVVAVLTVGLLALGTRVLHWDGLADTADGLTASYDAERSLAVMRTGDVGPAGTVAIVLVAGLQVAALAALVPREHTAATVVLLLCASRAALVLACVRGVPAARRDGLGSLHVGSVPRAVAVGVTALGVVAGTVAAALDGSPWVGAAAALAAIGVVLLLVARCVRRLGGVTGDVLGACVEVAFAVLLVGVSAS